MPSDLQVHPLRQETWGKTDRSRSNLETNHSLGKAVTTILKPELVNNIAPIQTCAGIPGGIEASIHAMRQIYEDRATQGILLVDASNASMHLIEKLLSTTLSTHAPSSQDMSITCTEGMQSCL